MYRFDELMLDETIKGPYTGAGHSGTYNFD